ncbi:MAG: hypothetical protein ACFB21_04290 [Opitutales bacterium]
MTSAESVPPASVFDSSRYIWVPSPASWQNQFVIFEELVQNSSDDAVWLHLFADTRFRLFVNDRFVAYGPGRFVTQFPEFDSYDLAPWLDQPQNRVRVEVNFYGCSSFQSMPDGQPGFIAAGIGQGYDFTTPGHWQARVHRAWDENAPHFSFAQNPAEICDTRTLTAELSGDAPLVAPVEAPNQPWPMPAPRSVPYPAYTPLTPARFVRCGKLADDWRLVGFQTIDHDYRHEASYSRKKRRFATWLYAPKAQRASLQCFWSELELNGQPLQMETDTGLGNHARAELDLQQGWNFLSGRFEVLTKQWSYLLAVDKATGITFHAAPRQDERSPLVISPLEDEPQPLLVNMAAEQFALPRRWEANSGAIEPLTPGRLMGWDRFAEPFAAEDLPWAQGKSVGRQHAAAASWTLDFADEYYGQAVIDVEAPPGTVLDVAYDDWLSPDRGMVNLYSSNPFTDATDRFILRGGRQQIEVGNPRGGIYLQITLRNPDPDAEVELCLHDVFIRSRRTLSAERAGFESGESVFDWAFEKGLHTLVASTDEAYSDCPWRERGTYLGDGYVNIHLNRLLSHDFSIARRFLHLFAQAQREDGQLQPCAPSWLSRPHEDFTLIWMLALRDYWNFTGDGATVDELWPTIGRIFASSRWEAHASGLWNTIEGMHPFIDWGVLRSEREGEANAVLNLFRYGALCACADLAEWTGRADEARTFRESAAKVQDALEATLWIAEEGRFAPSLEARTPALHANILALHFGVGDPERLLAYLEPLLRDNYRRGIEEGQFSGHAELYFFQYLLPALAKNDRTELAETLIREHYGFLQNLGYPTLNECFSRAHRNVGSCCHSWSGSPAVYAVREICGLRQLVPGDPSRYVIDPKPSSLTEVECRLPLAEGSIELRLQRQGDGWQAHVSAPLAIEITAAPSVELA